MISVAPAASTSFSWRDRHFFDRRALPLYCIILWAVALCIVAVSAGKFAYDRYMVLELVAPVGFFAIIAWLVRWSSFSAMAGFVEATLLGMTASFVMTFCAAIFATANLPLADAALARADLLLFGFRRADLTAFVVAHPWFEQVMRWTYLSFGWTPQLLLAILFFTGRARLGWLLAITVALTLAVTVSLSWLVPAYGVPPYPYRFREVLDGLRAGELRRLDASLVTGIITFPSLHAADAVVLSWGYAKLGWVAAPLVALNVFMVGSAVVTGGHYVVDAIAGIVIAIVCIRVAARWQAAVDRNAKSYSSPRSAA